MSEVQRPRQVEMNGAEKRIICLCDIVRQIPEQTFAIFALLKQIAHSLLCFTCLSRNIDSGSLFNEIVSSAVHWEDEWKEREHGHA